MLLAAMALAYELEEERGRTATVAARARGAFGRMLQRVDAALDAGDTINAEAAAPSAVPLTRPPLPIVAGSTVEIRTSSPPPANESRFAPKPSSDL